MSSDEWAKVIKTIPRWAFITFEGGEVALRPDFPALVRLASERALGKVNIITNGTLLNDDFFKLLERTLILGISISLDGLETTHDALRGVSGAFRKSLCSVKKLSSRRFLSVIDIKTVLEPENMHELPALYLLCAELGADYLSLSLPNMIHLKQSADVYDNIDDALKNACFQPDKLSLIFEPDSKKKLSRFRKISFTP
ncbi:MAG: radical SAM protein [bacterium]|nr:radical SAM protein [bacterium]